MMGGGGGAILRILCDLPYESHLSDLTIRQRAADGGSRTEVCCGGRAVAKRGLCSRVFLVMFPLSSQSFQ